MASLHGKSTSHLSLSQTLNTFNKRLTSPCKNVIEKLTIWRVWRSNHLNLFGFKRKQQNLRHWAKFSCKIKVAIQVEQIKLLLFNKYDDDLKRIICDSLKKWLFKINKNHRRRKSYWSECWRIIMVMLVYYYLLC
jgi:hypothetical protein